MPVTVTFLPDYAERSRNWEPTINVIQRALGSCPLDLTVRVGESQDGLITLSLCGPFPARFSNPLTLTADIHLDVAPIAERWAEDLARNPPASN